MTVKTLKPKGGKIEIDYGPDEPEKIDWTWIIIIGGVAAVILSQCS